MRRSFWVGTWIASIAAVAAVICPSNVSAANRPSAHAVTHSRPIRSRTARVVTRHVVDRAALVSRDLSEQPVHPHLIEVQVVNTTIWLDPDKDYIRQGFYNIDENQHVPAAQRLALSLRAPRARTYWGSRSRAYDSQHTIRPFMILMKPQFRNAPMPARPQQRPDRKRNAKLASVAS